MTQEVLKLALDALELNNKEWKSLADSGDAGYWLAEEQDHYQQTEQAITAIKEDLAQPEQEPVGEIGWAANIPNTIREVNWTELCPPVGTKLYTTPPQRTWVGLTPDEIRGISLASGESLFSAIMFTHDKLKEKNFDR